MKKIFILIFLVSCGKINMNVDSEIVRTNDGPTVNEIDRSRNEINQDLLIKRFDNGNISSSGYHLKSMIYYPIVSDTNKVKIKSMDDKNEILYVSYKSFNENYSVIESIDVSNENKPKVIESEVISNYVIEKVYALNFELLIVAKRVVDNKILLIGRDYYNKELKIRYIIDDDNYQDSFFKNNELTIITKNYKTKLLINGLNFVEISKENNQNITRFLSSLNYDYHILNSTGYYLSDKNHSSNVFGILYDYNINTFLTKQNSITYINNGKNLTLSIIDNAKVLNDNNPEEISHLTLYGESNDIKFTQQKIYLAQGSEGFDLVNVQDLQNPDLLGKLLFDEGNDNSKLIHILKDDRTIILADDNNGLRIISKNNINLLSNKIQISAKSNMSSSNESKLMIMVNNELVETKTINAISYSDFIINYNRNINYRDSIKVILHPMEQNEKEFAYVNYVKVNNVFCYQKETSTLDDIGLTQDYQTIEMNGFNCETSITQPLCLKGIPKIPFENCNLNNNKIGELTCSNDGMSYYCKEVGCSSGFFMSSTNTCEPQLCTPNNNESCSVANGIGSRTCNSDGSSLGTCNISSCNIGFHIEGGVCTVDTRVCSANNGLGNQTWNGINYDSCILSSCDAGFYLNNNTCVPKICQENQSYSCSIDNGVGLQLCNGEGSSYGQCSVVSCQSGYHVEEHSCISDIKICNIPNGSGYQTWNGSSYGSCEPVSCDNNYHIENNQCIVNQKSCVLSNGNGYQDWNGTSYGTCYSVSCDTGYHIENGNCSLDSRSCNFQNGSGTQAWNGSSYSACVLDACNIGYHEENGQCLSDTKNCSITNGFGSQVWNGSSYNLCLATSCQNGYTLVGNSCEAQACVPNTINSCSVINGVGSHQCNASGMGFNSCTIQSCNSGYHEENGQCLSDVKSCLVSNGSGIQSWNGSSYGLCISNSCDNGYHIESGVCVSDIKSCSLTDGVGNQYWNGLSYGSCNPISCDSGYHIESGACKSNTKSCAVSNGAGTQTWNGVDYNMCAPITCNTGYHIDNNQCISNTQSCSISNGVGSQEWNGISYGSCSVVSCNTGFHEENGVCESNTKSCAVSNGAGNQSWNGSSYGICAVSSCNTGFHIESGSCLSNTKTCYVTNGAGTQTWNGSSYGACSNVVCNSGALISVWVSGTSSCPLCPLGLIELFGICI